MLPGAVHVSAVLVVTQYKLRTRASGCVVVTWLVVAGLVLVPVVIVAIALKALMVRYAIITAADVVAALVSVGADSEAPANLYQTVPIGAVVLRSASIHPAGGVEL